MKMISNPEDFGYKKLKGQNWPRSQSWSQFNRAKMTVYIWSWSRYLQQGYLFQERKRDWMRTQMLNPCLRKIGAILGPRSWWGIENIKGHRRIITLQSSLLKLQSHLLLRLGEISLSNFWQSAQASMNSFQASIHFGYKEEPEPIT
jgi:hypothetical protein